MVKANECETIHAVQDQAKVDAIAKDMRAHGWQGVPVVTVDYTQITGVHRRAAWLAAGNRLADMPTVDLFDLCPSLKEEWQEICENALTVGVWEIGCLRNLVPAEIAEKYGIEQ